jgi:hypothetical protein
MLMVNGVIALGMYVLFSQLACEYLQDGDVNARPGVAARPDGQLSAFQNDVAKALYGWTGPTLYAYATFLTYCDSPAQDTVRTISGILRLSLFFLIYSI